MKEEIDERTKNLIAIGASIGSPVLMKVDVHPADIEFAPGDADMLGDAIVIELVGVQNDDLPRHGWV